MKKSKRTRKDKLVEHLIQENKRLLKENQELRALVASLEKKVEELKKLQKENRELRALVAKLEKKIEELKSMMKLLLIDKKRRAKYIVEIVNQETNDKKVFFSEDYKKDIEAVMDIYSLTNIKYRVRDVKTNSIVSEGVVEDK